MKLKKTISTPIIGGLIFGAISFLTTAANLTIQITDDIFLGPWEIFNILSAGLFGPIGLLITELGLDVSGYLYLINGVFPEPLGIYYVMSNYIAHYIALFPVIFGYRFIYQRMKIPRLLGGWAIIVSIFYILGIVLSVLLHNIAVPGLGVSYNDYLNNSVLVEYVLVTIITLLIILALPERYRRPRWFDPKNAPDHNIGNPED
jgi:hypothetical protein